MNDREIQRVCFVGAGTMGCFNAVKAALSGYQVVLYDINANSLQQSLDRQREMADFLAASGYCDPNDIPAALARVTLHADLTQAVAGAELLSESVFERLDIKREVHRQLDRLCPPHTIVTTNSSFMLVSEIEDVAQHGERFAAMHSYIASPLVDIVGGPRTAPAVIDRLRSYVESLHAVPLVLKREFHGYVLNAMLGPVLTTAMYLLIEGGASCEEVDRAWMLGRRAPMGPLGILDMIGLGLVCDSWLHRTDEGPIPGLRDGVLQLLQPYVDREALGIQSGSGFYHYPNPAYQGAGFLQAGPEREDLYTPLVLALVSSALVVAAHDIADPEDIDRAWMVGTSLDQGPFGILEYMGKETFLALLADHVAAGRYDPHSARQAMDYLA